MHRSWLYNSESFNKLNTSANLQPAYEIEHRQPLKSLPHAPPSYHGGFHHHRFILSVLEIYINGIIRYVLIQFWILSLSIIIVMCVRFLHVFACSCISLILIDVQIFHYIYIQQPSILLLRTFGLSLI